MAHSGSSVKPISDELYALCTSNESVSSILAKDPTAKPGDAWKKLYGHDHKLGKRKSFTGVSQSATDEELLRRTAECGKWGPTQPSELFLRVSSALSTLV